MRQAGRKSSRRARRARRSSSSRHSPALRGVLLLLAACDPGLDVGQDCKLVERADVEGCAGAVGRDGPAQELGVDPRLLAVERLATHGCTCEHEQQGRGWFVVRRVVVVVVCAGRGSHVTPSHVRVHVHATLTKGRRPWGACASVCGRGRRGCKIQWSQSNRIGKPRTHVEPVVTSNATTQAWPGRRGLLSRAFGNHGLNGRSRDHELPGRRWFSALAATGAMARRTCDRGAQGRGLQSWGAMVVLRQPRSPVALRAHDGAVAATAQVHGGVGRAAVRSRGDAPCDADSTSCPGTSAARDDRSPGARGAHPRHLAGVPPAPRSSALPRGVERGTGAADPRLAEQSWVET